MAISINGNTSIQPSTVKEELLQVLHDRVSINGTSTRIWLNQKHQATLTFSAINLSQYETLIGYFTGSANPVTYLDTATGYSFVGYPTNSEDTYLPGASYLKNLTVTILEQ